MTCHKEDTKNCFVLEGKMALPNQFFVGRTGSKFIIAMRDKKKIMGLKCKKCNMVFIPPREYCIHCLSKIDENWVDLGNEGELVNYTIVRYQDKHLPKKAPYILGQIKLQGADTPLTHIVTGIDPSEVKVGMKVKAVFAEKTTSTLMDLDHFEPA
ncbi:MAG: Zn-ribbon domain-containing OB-fold protein [Syntrophales bacterium]|jgi:uncharacterized OB-fold protein